MGFETVVLSAIKDVARDVGAEFSNGTLFMDNTNRAEVNMISEFLKSYVRCEQIITAGPDGYFTIDFGGEL
jgi:hypothetical protein